jgi:WD40 repeat protein/serine/threonine protein kinase
MGTNQASEETILEQALSFDTPEERAAYLRGACAGNPELRARIESLIQAHQAAGRFLPERMAEAISMVQVPVPEAEAGTLIGHYKLLQRIGEGGCGLVYMAEQHEPVRRRVALKVIKLGMDTKQVIARFEAERQALALMEHPNIAKVLDAGATESGRPYFVMELVRGVKITEYCDQKNLSTGERLKLFIQVCQAIQHAHQKGIIHRDIKPSNILVTVNDGVAVPKVIDFGIAKATAGQQLTNQTIFTAFEQFIGTPAYMSPEQAELTSVDIDTRSDIYSLGVLLYELLTGKTPFDPNELMAAGLDEMRRTIRDKEPPRPSTRLGTLPGEELSTTAQRRSLEAPKLISLLRGDLDWIAMKCLEKDRSRRYETANGLAMDIQRHLSQEAVIARPPSTAYRLQKLVRRNKVAFGAAAAVAGALILGIIISTWQAIRATRARREAEAARQSEVQMRKDAQASEQKAQQAREGESKARQLAEANKLIAERNLYVANMNSAQQAWSQNNIGRLKQLLDETATFPGRGFEWYYWQRQTHLELKTFRGHIDQVNSVAFSPDGRRIVTGSGDNTAKVWDATSGKELTMLKGHRAPVDSVAFSSDGRRILTGSFDATAKMWQAASGKELITFRGHTSDVFAVVVSPDGLRIVTGSADRAAKIWDAASGEQLLTLTGHTDDINSIAFSGDGRRIATGSVDKTAKVWDAATGRELLTLRGHSAAVNSVAFSADGQRIITSSADQTVKVWIAATGEELQTLRGHSGGILTAAISADGQWIATGSEDQAVKVWDAATGKELLTLRGHSGAVSSMAFSPDSQRIVTGSWDHTAKVWETSNKEILILRGHSRNVDSASFSPDGRWIVTGSWDATAKVWDSVSGEESFSLGHSDEVKSVAFSQDGQRIVTSSADHTARVWDANKGKELFALKGHSLDVWSAAFSQDGRRIVTGSWDQTAKVWDAASGQDLLTLRGHTGGVVSVAFSPDGRRIVTGSWGDKTARVWDAADGKELLTLKGHGDAVNSVAFSPDGQTIVTGSNDGTALVWDALSGSNLLTLRAHSGEVWGVAFSPDGQRIVTGSADRTAKLWEATSGKELLTLVGHTEGIMSVAFSTDGRRIVTASFDHTARVWDAATEQQVSSWQREEREGEGRVAAMRREQEVAAERERAVRAQDPGAIKQWLVLAPISFEDRDDLAALNQQQISQEINLRPGAGEKVIVGQRERVWNVVQLEDYVLDFNRLLGKATEWSVAYAVCYILSETKQSGLLMEIGSDDQAKVYLNGKEIYRCEHDRTYIADQDEVPNVELQAGLNVLVFKVVNGTGDWQGSIRLTDKDGNQVKGISVTLTPP